MEKLDMLGFYECKLDSNISSSIQKCRDYESGYACGYIAEEMMSVAKRMLRERLYGDKSHDWWGNYNIDINMETKEVTFTIKMKLESMQP
jgi:hypothetical protein